MESSFSTAERHQLDRFCRQYLQAQLELDYPSKEYLRQHNFQQAIYRNLFHEDVVKHAPPVRYQFRVLKELIGRIEESVRDWEEEAISDDLMSCFSNLFTSNIPSEATSAQQKSYVTYSIASLPSPFPEITLLEARNLVAAAGTTGLRTWEAALHLGNYLSTNLELVKGRAVLELGAGTGYVSVLCAKYLGATHVVATDGSDDVVADLPTNFYLNSLQDSSVIEAKGLKWGQVLMGGEQPEWNGGRKIDLVLGADITYDGRTTVALVATFEDLFELFPHTQIIIAATIRNEKTFETFLETCGRNRYRVEKIEYDIPKPDLQKGPFYSDKIPIRLNRITKL
ncbi:hypothetical protein EG329_013009 [Mollisiaceae sp. DMI_Dod_QoI]|nr:hypothetical protein EG329_013009 [Helotiales sp. DMI_Dod_QoI]